MRLVFREQGSDSSGVIGKLKSCGILSYVFCKNSVITKISKVKLGYRNWTQINLTTDKYWWTWSNRQVSKFWNSQKMTQIHSEIIRTGQNPRFWQIVTTRRKTKYVVCILGHNIRQTRSRRHWDEVPGCWCGLMDLALAWGNEGWV